LRRAPPPVASDAGIVGATHNQGEDMRELSLSDLQQIGGGNILVALAAGFTVQGIWAGGAAINNYFGQDNGGPSAADWAAGTGYIG
jgi:hypothetical protein